MKLQKGRPKKADKLSQFSGRVRKKATKILDNFFNCHNCDSSFVAMANRISYLLQYIDSVKYLTEITLVAIKIKQVLKTFCQTLTKNPFLLPLQNHTSYSLTPSKIDNCRKLNSLKIGNVSNFGIEASRRRSAWASLVRRPCMADRQEACTLETAAESLYT